MIGIDGPVEHTANTNSSFQDQNNTEWNKLQTATVDKEQNIFKDFCIILP